MLGDPVLPSSSLVLSPLFYLLVCGSCTGPQRTGGSDKKGTGPKLWPWVKIQIVPPVNIPIPTKIGKMGGDLPTKMGSRLTVLTATSWSF